LPTLSLVIPAFNEEERLPALLRQLRDGAEAEAERAAFELKEAIVVDDGSTDDTVRLLAEAAETWPTLRPVRGAVGNAGKGAAIAAGVREARGDFVLFADVDLSTPLSEAPKLGAAIRDGADLAIGSREIPGATVERGPLHRKVTGKGFNGVVRALTGLDVNDTQCGFKLMRTEVARELLETQLCPGFAFDVELLVRAQMAGLQIAEVPILYVHDSRSRVRVASASVRMLADVAELSYRLRPRRSSRGDIPIP
jgi:glycosyltransferase involved in cell wall biosynthesis